MTDKHFPFLQTGSADGGVSRRDFLRWASCGLVIATAPSLGGCGGGGGGGGNGGGGGSNNTPPPGGGGSGVTPGAGTVGAPVSEALRSATFSNIEAQFASLTTNSSRFDPVAMVNFLSQQPAFYEVGYSTDSDCAWAVFTDGRKLMIINNVDPFALPASVTGNMFTAQQSGASEKIAVIKDIIALPTAVNTDQPLIVADQFRLINTWENAAFWTVQPLLDYTHVTQDWVKADTVPSIGRIASGLGFDVIEQGIFPGLGLTVDRSRIGEVADFVNVSGDGVFFLTGSAGHFDTSEESIAAICTSSRAGTALENEYADDMSSGALIYAMALDHLDPGTRTYLAITPQFVRDHNWSFPRESLVFLNVTGGGYSRWMDVMFVANAGMLMGWSVLTDPRTMLGVAQDFFELLLGTNRVDGGASTLQIEPRLRFYGVEETLDFLRRVSLIYNTTNNGIANQLENFTGPSEPFITELRPAIQWIAVNEDLEEIMLQGRFGEQDLVTSQVRIGNSTDEIRDSHTNAAVPELALVADQPLTNVNSDTLEIIDWRHSFIRVNARSGSGLETGMIQVWQRNRYSNVAHLTRWRIPFQITRTVAGTFQRSVTMEVDIRAFVGGYRLWPDQPLNAQWLYVNISARKTAAIGWSASGSAQQVANGATTTVTWSGAGNYSVSVPETEFFRMDGILAINSRRIDCNLGMYVINGLKTTTHSVSSTGESTVEDYSDFRVETPDPSLLNLGYYDFGIPIPGPLSLHFDSAWNLSSNNVIFYDNDESGPFGGDNCATQIIWPAVNAEFPPERDRGGR